MLLRLILSIVVLTFVIFAFFKPKTAFIMAIFFMFDGFGLLSWLFKEFAFSNSIDFCYVMLTIVYFSLSVRNKGVKYFETKDYFVKLILLFTALVVFEFFYTVIRYDQSYSLTFNVARQYIGLLAFYPTVLVLHQTNLNMERVFKVILVISIIGVITYILGVFFNLEFLEFMFKIGDQDIVSSRGTYYIKRVYGGVMFPLFLVGGSLFAYLIENQFKNKKAFYWFVFVLFFLQPLLSYSRGYLITYIVTLVVVIILSKKSIQVKTRSLIFTVVISVFVILILSNYMYDDSLYLGDTFIARMFQTQEDVSENTGTYGLRNEIVAERWKLVDDSPVFGAGLVHPKSGLYGEYSGIIGTAHNGYIQIFSLFGYSGFILFVLVSLFFMLMAYKVSNLDVPFQYRALALTCIGSTIGSFFNMVSSSSAFSAPSLTFTGMLAGLFYYLITKHKKDGKESR